MKVRSVSNARFVMLTFQKQDLNRHVVAIHEGSAHEGKEPFKCNVCSATFTEKGSLKQHVSTIHERKNPFKCKICDAVFTHKENLKNHVSSIHEK